MMMQNLRLRLVCFHSGSWRNDENEGLFGGYRGSGWFEGYRGACAGSVTVCAMHSMQINYATLYAKLFNLLFVASAGDTRTEHYIVGFGSPRTQIPLFLANNCFAIKI